MTTREKSKGGGGASVPAAAALLIIDMINDLDFTHSDQLARHFKTIAPVIAGLRDQADAAGVPVIYINDNLDKWHCGLDELIAHCLGKARDGRDAIERVRPRKDDFFVIKPRFSGFYATTLPVLLPKLGVGRLILTGVAADICVLFTAADAHMREYGLWVPADAVASSNTEHRDWALGIMAKSMDAEVRPSTELSVAEFGQDDDAAGSAGAPASSESSARLRSIPQR